MSDTNPQELQAAGSAEFAGNDVRTELFAQMLVQLASDHAATVEYYAVPGKRDPMIEREGAAWERFVVLHSTDDKYGIGIHFLKNDPDWQSKDSMRMTPRGESDRLRMVILEKSANVLSSITFSPDFEALIETVPDNYAGAWIQELGKPGRPHRGRIETWERGQVFDQDVREHVGTTDMDTYTPPRQMTEEELTNALDLIHVNGPDAAELDSEIMARAMRVMQYGRFGGSIIVDEDPFKAMLAKTPLIGPAEQ